MHDLIVGRDVEAIFEYRAKKVKDIFGGRMESAASPPGKARRGPLKGD